MKKLLLLLSLIISSFSLFAQIDFAPIGSHFYYLYQYESNSWPYYSEYSIADVEVLRDTTIDGHHCKIMSKSHIGWPLHGDEIIMYEEENSVYFYNAENETFNLLYDYNKDVGESWEVSFDAMFDPFHLEVTVDSISYTQLNDQNIKVLHVSGFDATLGSTKSYTIYEGIGCIEHMFFETSWHYTTSHDWIRGLRCFDSTVDGLFKFTEEECDMVTHTTTPDQTLNIQVSPNPASTFIEIRGNGHFHYTLYDTQGVQIQNQKKQYTYTSIDVSHLPKGIYFLKIQQGNNFLTRKVVIE